MEPKDMDWIWNAVVAVLCLLTTLANMILIWWKVASQNLLITETIKKLSVILDKLDEKVSEHHLDNAIHRNPDFETKIDTFMERNAQDHATITALIREQNI